jgi:hypothetical protein
MNALLQLISGKKTYLTTIAMFILLFGQWQAWWKIDQNVYLALTAAAVAFLRAGVAKGPGGSSTSPTGSSPVSSARLPLMLAFACFIALCGGTMISGCSTTAQQATYQAAGTTAVSVDTAMTLWGTYVAQTHPPIVQEQTVADAYAKYQSAMASVCDAGAVYAAANAAGTNTVYGSAASASLALQQAITNANQEIIDLENLITSFGVKLQ